MERRRQLACSEPKFWDAGVFYEPVSVPLTLGPGTLLGAGVVGAVTGGGLAAMARKQRKEEAGTRQPVTVDELEQKL